MIRPSGVLCAWIAIGAALITVPALLHRARQRPAPAAGPAGPPVRELPGPAAAAAPVVLQAPIAHAGPTANGTNGFGHPPPMLFGRVTDATGAPYGRPTSPSSTRTATSYTGVSASRAGRCPAQLDVAAMKDSSGDPDRLAAKVMA
jgi:hypothetical protein